MIREYNIGCPLKLEDEVVCIADDSNNYIGCGVKDLIGSVGTVNFIHENGAISVVFAGLKIPEHIGWSFNSGTGLYFHNADKSLELCNCFEPISEEDFLSIFN